MKQDLDQQTIPLAEPFAENVYEKALPEHYRLIELIGRGGMAEVFRAEDMRLNRYVAIKFLNSEFRKDPERMRRFHQEARAASALNHPNIITIHDIGENEGIQYLVSEFVQGETLNSMISRGRIPIANAVDIAIQVASALAASHNAGIVHRDIKPDNVMLRRDGSVKVLDFGLAKETGISVPSTVDFDANTITTAATSPGLVLGTPRYMSPEQARGQHLDGRTDIFSLGIMLFEMVTGRPPFTGDTMVDVIAAIISKDPRTLEEYLDDPPLTLIHIVKKTLRKDREERYGSMEHLLSDLRDLKQELGGESYVRVDTAPERTRVTDHHTLRHFITDTFVRRPPLGVFLIFIVVILAAGIWWNLGGQSTATPSSPGAMRSVAITNWSSREGISWANSSFSPDSRMIVFSSTQSGQGEIWVKPTEDGEPVQVTKDGYYSQHPIWSPDSQEVVYFSIRGSSRGIWRSPFTGGIQTLVTSGIGQVGPDVRPVYWSASGKIYYQERSELFAVDEAGGEITQITFFESNGLKPQQTMEISPDETAVAYTVIESGLWKLRIRKLAEGSDTEVVSASKFIPFVAWHHDSKSLLFSSSIDGAFQIFEASADGQGDPVRISAGDADLYVQDVSRDGSKILYSAAAETSDLWLVDTDSRRETIVSNEEASEYWPDVRADGGVVFQSMKQVDRHLEAAIVTKRPGGRPATISTEGFLPTWSKNGEWIAYLKRSETGYGLWRIRPEGDGRLKLADGELARPSYVPMPSLKSCADCFSWSPNSTALAYAAKTDGVSNIWLVAVDGSGNEKLTANGDASESYCCPAWMPDGKHLVFVSTIVSKEDPNRLSYRLLVKGRSESPVVIFESDPQFRFLGMSGDGKDAYIAQRADPTIVVAKPQSVYIFSVSTMDGTVRKLHELSDIYYHSPRISHDGKSLAFVSRRNHMSGLWAVPLGGGTPRSLVTENDPKVMFSDLAWSPDGRSIVFGKQTRTNLLSMLVR